MTATIEPANPSVPELSGMKNFRRFRVLPGSSGFHHSPEHPVSRTQSNSTQPKPRAPMSTKNFYVSSLRSSQCYLKKSGILSKISCADASRHFLLPFSRSSLRVFQELCVKIARPNTQRVQPDYNRCLGSLSRVIALCRG